MNGKFIRNLSSIFEINLINNLNKVYFVIYSSNKQDIALHTDISGNAYFIHTHTHKM